MMYLLFRVSEAASNAVDLDVVGSLLIADVTHPIDCVSWEILPISSSVLVVQGEEPQGFNVCFLTQPATNSPIYIAREHSGQPTRSRLAIARLYVFTDPLPTRGQILSDVSGRHPVVLPACDKLSL